MEICHPNRSNWVLQSKAAVSAAWAATNVPPYFGFSTADVVEVGGAVVVFEVVVPGAVDVFSGPHDTSSNTIVITDTTIVHTVNLFISFYPLFVQSGLYFALPMLGFNPVISSFTSLYRIL
jgi:hypothetical protein